MATIVPGAVWHPIDVGKRAARAKGRGVVGHVAVSSAHLLVPTAPPATRNADWTFYLPKVADPAGRFFQLIDLDLQCWASAAGNGSLPAWESEGGLGTAEEVNAEPWTDNQVEAGAIILAFLNETEGTPLQVMPDSRPTSRGLAPHRLGIDPWRVPGGESWSSSAGKLCPGDAKVAQISTIVSRAVELRHGSPTPPPAPVHPSATHPPILRWPLPRGHYVGAKTGPANCHGGDPRYDSAAVCAFVENVLRWFIYHGVTSAPASTWATSSWARGGWDAPYGDPAAKLWHARSYPGQPYPAQIWADDYARLARP